MNAADSLPPALQAQLAAARAAAAQGRIGEAERHFRQLVGHLPELTEGLNFLGMCELARQQTGAAIVLFERARQVAPDDAETLKNLGQAQRRAGDLDAAVATLRAAVTREPDYFLARFHLAATLEQLQRHDEALPEYFRALRAAQQRGEWLSEASTPPGLRQPVLAAMRYVDQGRHALFDGAIAPLRARYGAAEMRRIEQALAIYLGDAPANYPHPAQRPLFMFFPGIASQAYYERERFPWLEAFEAKTDAIRLELLNLLAADHGFEPFLRFDSTARVEDYLRGREGQLAWTGYFFYRHGERREDNCARCPVTIAALDALPIVRIREHAPEVLFSLLTPGAHILPHCGVTNTRLVTHLPLIVPNDCALRVGGVEHAWQEGRCVVFDDTYEHEAWNRSDRTRVVLILDTWHPDLTAAEREALTALVSVIGDFNQKTGVR
ncbi:MAG: aspartyl/asparaginyl beta-hydroxylase domain-containing protein [Rhodanobacteraceae bacterium]|nr:aspartyl/asparaginyl beta-hydroxylase domain-containing protein [Rhodanobacteraceae bacterium]